MRNEGSAQTLCQQKAASVAAPRAALQQVSATAEISPGDHGSPCHPVVPQLSILCQLSFLSASLSRGTQLHQIQSANDSRVFRAGQESHSQMGH